MASAEHARTLRQKNITLINAAGDIFGLQTRNWDSVKRKITPAQVREFYEVVARLWPPSTDLLSMLPPPDSTLRALYLGEYAPELILQNVCRFGLYADEIILINPFNNPNLMRDEYNPIVHPEEWMEDTLRTLFQLLAMAPWVDQGFVTFIPNPGEFDRDLLMKTVALAEERLKKNPITDEDVHDSIFREQTLKKFKSSPPDYLARIYREMDPDVSDDQVQDLVKHFEAERLADPFLTGQTMDKMPPQMLANRTGASLEMGLYICRAIGAFPYTNFRFRWKELLGAREQLDPTSEIWTPLTKAFQDLDFKFLDHVDSEFACTMRSEGRLGGFRAYLRKVWTSVSGSPDASQAERLARDFKDELSQSYEDAKKDWSEIDMDLMKWAGGGTLIGAASAAISNGTFSLAMPAAGFALGGVTELIRSRMKRRNFLRTVPMSAFIQLDERHKN